jgi:asparagine synthase (glutamine-hydrolysing)
MCGIAGFYDLGGHRNFDLALLKRLNNEQRARGPDDEGYFAGPGFAVAHRRLSIIDLAHGHQPIFNENKRVAVVFNGEIYNYKELIKDLQKQGHQFQTQCDTEVIVHAWEEWGEACVTRFRGMFAFAVLDADRDILFLARDRLGVKPLLYTVLRDGTFMFASDMKVLKGHPLFDNAIDLDALDDFLTVGYVLDPGSIYKSVRKLEAGKSLTVSRSSSSLSPRRYWNVSFAQECHRSSIHEDSVSERLLDLLDESVRLRMVSDVPVGAFLSGGVDSSAVVASMALQSESAISTFSIGFDHREYDETAYSREVANRYDTQHFERIVSSDDFRVIDRFADLFSEPFADTSAIPMLRVSELASEHLKVVLSGDGADEVFGGYRRHRMHLFESGLRNRLKSFGMVEVGAALASIYPKLDWAPRFLRAKSTLEALAMQPCDAYHFAVSIARPKLRGRIYSEYFKNMIDGEHSLKEFRRHYEESGTSDALKAVQYVDMKTYLVGDINTKVDRTSMAYSLESREPLMDHRLVEFAASLPSRLNIRGRNGKYLFKKSMENRLSHEILYRPKMGFVVPLQKWFRGPLASKVANLSKNSAVAESGFFEVREIDRLIDEHSHGSVNHERILSSLLILDSFLSK